MGRGHSDAALTAQRGEHHDGVSVRGGVGGLKRREWRSESESSEGTPAVWGSGMTSPWLGQACRGTRRGSI